MDCIIIDIETRPDPRIWDDPEAVAEMREGLSAPSNYKDPVKIAAYVDDQIDRLKDAAALKPTLGRIACIGRMDFADYDPSAPIDEIAARVTAPAGDDEAALIAGLVMDLCIAGRCKLGGYFLRDFDLPFLTYRAAVHGIDLPEWWPGRRDWHGIVDPCDLFPREQSGSLDAHLRAMGLPRKTATGKESLTMPYPQLSAYCAHDVVVEAALIYRLRGSLTALKERTAA